ncbi:hypothetical protein PUN28_020100 [Cardiocondyla obscurior]|uniref:Uncharacterized protein n=1 Tax=Cardiocondyla obscurior TaxID=286306 RepID=A0AAW2EAF6_9HYME
MHGVKMCPLETNNLAHATSTEANCTTGVDLIKEAPTELCCFCRLVINSQCHREQQPSLHRFCLEDSIIPCLISRRNIERIEI